MWRRRGRGRQSSERGEFTVSDAAIRTGGTVLAAMAGRIRTHAYPDGGLICEDRTSRARPSVWRISPDGSVVPASVYSFARREFIAGRIPQTGSQA